MARHSGGQHRHRSGYTRGFGLADVLVFNIMGFSLGLALSTNPPFIGANSPGAAIAWVIVSGALLALTNGLVYGWFAGAMPATGGDYIFVSRSFYPPLGPLLGFLANWGFTACQLYGLSINIGWIVTVALAPAVQALGLASDSTKIASLAFALTDPATATLSSLGLLSLYYIVYLTGSGAGRWLVYLLFMVALIGPALMAYIVSTTSHADFVSAFDAWMKVTRSYPDAYASAIRLGVEKGMTLDVPVTMSATLQAVPLGFLCFLGFTYSVYVGGEVRRADKSQIFGILGALAIGTVTFVYIMGAYVHMVGRPFNAAMGNSDVAQALGLLGGSINIPLAMVAPSKTLALVMLVCNSLWFLLIPYVIMQVCVHNFVAWSCDNLGPTVWLKRLPGTNAPWAAGLTVTLVTAFSISVNAIWGFSLLGAVALAAVAFTATGLAAFRFPRVRHGDMSRLPSLARVQVAGVTLFQLVGLVSAVGFAWIVVEAVRVPEISGGTGFKTLIHLGFVYGLGLLWYAFFSGRNTKRGQMVDVDLQDLLREIPSD